MKTGSSPFGRTKNRGTVKSTQDSRSDWMKNGGHVSPAIHEKPLVDPRAKPGEDELGCSNLNGICF